MYHKIIKEQIIRVEMENLERTHLRNYDYNIRNCQYFN